MQHKLTILLVEDNEGDVEMTQRAIHDSRIPCHLAVAHDGEEALDFLNKRGAFAEAPTPQLILLDLNMPRMGGKELLNNLKADPVLKSIPVVMLTSSQSPHDIRECYERHASFYVVKPFDGNEFDTALRDIVAFWSKHVRTPHDVLL